MLKLPIFLFLLLIPVFCSAQYDELYFTNISMKDGLSQGVVYCIYQDQQSFMWFGTGDGLNKYDGYKFSVYKHSPSDSTTISNNMINCIVEDHSGNLWIGTMNGLNRFDPQTEKFERYLHRSDHENGICNNYVKSLLIDSNGYLWIGTDHGLNRLDLSNGQFSIYDFDEKLHHTRIFSILEDSRNEMWLATQRSGLIRFHPETFQYTQYTYQAGNPQSINSDHVYTLYEDSNQQLWIGTWEYGVSRFVRGKDIFERLKTKRDGTGLNNEQIRCIIENEGNIWIGTFEGLNIYDPVGKNFTYCQRYNNVPGTLSYNIINCMFRDHAGSIWMGTNGGGVDLYDPSFGQFKLIDPKTKVGHDYGTIGPIIENKGKIWIGTEGGGLACYDLKTRDYRFYNLDEPTLSSNTIKDLCIDRNNRLWIGTYAAGIKTFNLETLRFEKHFDRSNGIDNNIVNDIHEDFAGNIWVGSNSEVGIHFKGPIGDKFTAGYPTSSDSQHIDFPWIRAIFEPSPNEFWFGSIYYGIYIFKNRQMVKNISVTNSNLSSDYISVITKDSKDRIWVGTYGGGVNIFSRGEQEITTLTVANGLLNDNVCSIIEDSLSNIWISTIAGISMYDEIAGSFTNFSYQNGNFPIEIVNLRSGLYASDGNIYYGGNNGLAYFNPKSIRQNKYLPPVVITQLLLNNKPVKPFDETHILTTAIHHTPEITLKHNQSNITLEFAALNYIYPLNNQYMFQLAGYDKDWIDLGFQRYATYTNLPEGKYVFYVKAGNNSGIWNDTGTQLVIRILPPPWRTWWAYLVYFVVFIGMTYAIMSWFMTRVRLKNDIRLKQLEKISLEKTHQMRINLFTNFSHELRTPLTLILDPLKTILADTNCPSTYKEPLNIVYKNAKKILQVVNELMDFRKHESGHMEVKVREGDIVKFLREITIIFRELTGSKNINLQMHCNEKKIVMYFDHFLLEKVFYNILSNAVKNTPENGIIQLGIGLRYHEKVLKEIGKRVESGKLPKVPVYVEFVVKDTGIGITPDNLDKIFDPFFQISGHNAQGVHGTGIGLSITKGIVELHHGLIWAESKPNKGATFKIILPVDSSLYRQQDFSDVENDNDQYQDVVDVADQKSEETVVKKGLPIVLVVDDNSDIRSYIRNQMKSEYEIYEAENGAVGLQLSQELIPDLIISDIMMPEIDGLEFSRQLKNDIKTVHIPIILLTARTTILQIKEGLDVGADDYLTKPFDAELLKAKVKSLIENRKRLKEAYIRSFNVDLPSPLVSNMDKTFMTQAYNFIKDHLGNNELTIEEFGRQLRLSRTQLYRKIKALTGMSPSLFVSTLRLKVAAELLVETSLSVSEIAYKVGFENPSYFSSSFKKLYGVSPKEYAAMKKNGE